ncbi:hybrid sensor histidine kinase/response regulator [Winogradskyella ursingii]|uniref:hybrid sensor histidine kinase/response regulator n=1 Tax=Winogradskyella ursingii TaxID=2686079 RepID=UPI0015C968FE|nr:hybrid sensor histidine kinase/response regulator [Winogradskyella ursingii]
MKRLLLITYLLASTLYAQNKAFDPETSQGDLYEYSEYVNTGDLDFSIEDILKLSSLEYQDLKSENHDFGFNSDTHWIRFQLENSSNSDKKYYLETARAITDIANLYQIGKTIKLHRSGDQIEFAQRDVEHRQTVFDFTLPAKSLQEFYLEIKSDGETTNLPLNLYTPSGFTNKNNKQQLFLGLFYGVLLLAGLIYLFFYKSLKNKAFLFYGLYVFSIALMQASLDGFIYQYFFTNGGYVNSRMVLIAALFSNYYLLKYCEYFLNINENLSAFKKVYSLIYTAIAILFVMIFISPATLELVYPLSNLNGLLSLILILSSIFTMRYKKMRVDPYFSFGIFFLVVGLLGFVMNNLGLLPSNFYTLNSSKFGTGFEVIFLSLSMTNLIRKLREDNDHSQALALKKSEEISEMKTFFMSNISHELRTPINAIMGMVEDGLSDVNNSIETRKNYQVIKNASISLLSSVSDVLDFERIEKNELKLHEETFNPSIALHQISDNWKSEANKKGLKYRFEMDSEIPTSLIGDADRFVQIINNVLANAVKFTNVGSVKLKLKCLDQPNDVSRFYLQISDTGVGMDDDNKLTVFDSFNQMRLSHKRQFGGIGLGLTIVEHLVKLFKGKITIESELNKGTDVFIEIPLKQVAKIDTQDLIEDNNSTLKPLHVLIVEDNKLNQMVMRKLLGGLINVSFAVVNNGKEAIDTLKNEVYDLVLMDLQMPIMDGYEATTIIRSGELGEVVGSIPIIAVTADAMEDTRRRVLELGMNDYMTKPIKKELLVEKMQGCIKHHKLSVA